MRDFACKFKDGFTTQAQLSGHSWGGSLNPKPVGSKKKRW